MTDPQIQTAPVHRVEQSGQVFVVIAGDQVVATHEDPSAALVDRDRRNGAGSPEYGTGSLTGFDGGDPETAFAQSGDPAPAVSPAALIADAKISEPTPAPFDVIEPFTGKTFKFVHPNEVASMDSVLLLELRAALTETAEGSDAFAEQALLVVVRFLRAFMAPGELARFQSATRPTHKGPAGMTELLRWLNEDVGPLYSGFPTRPARS